MAPRSHSAGRLALLGELLKLLRQRQRTVRTVIIKPDGTIEVQLGLPWIADHAAAEVDDDFARWVEKNAFD
jgi:hypothetical protein